MGDPAADTCFSHLGAGSGGRFFSGPVSVLAEFEDILDTTIDADSSTILRVDSAVSNSTLVYSIPVDSHMSKLTVSLRADSANMTIIRPGGSPLATNGTDGVIVSKLSGITFISIKSPAIGEYTVNVVESGSFSLLSTGILAIRSSFWFSSVEGRSGHEGWYPLEAPPPLHSQIGAMADISGDFSTAEFTLRGPDYEVLHIIDLMAGP